jgi:dihydrofolate reductase
VAYGGARFASALIKYNLIDEYHLFVNPVAIGKGMSIYNALDEKLTLKLVKATQFECGITVLCYNPA